MSRCIGSSKMRPATRRRIGVGVRASHHEAGRPAVANMSLGGGVSPALDQAVANTVAAGVTVVVAAGNEYQDACYVSPARAPSAITVGATRTNDGLANFSNWGACVDINAPGVAIRSSMNSSNSASDPSIQGRSGS